MISRRTRGRCFAAVLIVAAALVSGCAEVDADALPGVYRSDETGGEITLESDGTFSATDISADESVGNGGADPLDFHGEWEFVATDWSSDFVYLTIEEGGPGTISGVQLYARDQETLEFNPDPDGAPTVTLTKA